MFSAPSFVNQSGNTASATSVTITYTSTPGSLLVAFGTGIAKGSSGLGSVSTITTTDSSGGLNTWITVGANDFAVSQTVAGVTSVTMSFAGTPAITHCAASLMEFKGVGSIPTNLFLSDPPSAAVGGISTAPSVTIGSPSRTPVLALSGIAWGDGLTGTAPGISAQTAGWNLGTLRSLAIAGGTKINISVQQVYQIAASTASLSYGATLSASENWLAEGFGFVTVNIAPTVAQQAVNRAAIF